MNESKVAEYIRENMPELESAIDSITEVVLRFGDLLQKTAREIQSVFLVLTSINLKNGETLEHYLERMERKERKLARYKRRYARGSQRPK